MVRALLLTHGELGRELRRVVELFLGPVEEIEAISNAGLSARELAAAVRGWLAAASAEDDPAALPRSTPPALVLVDEHGGSCATAARLAAAEFTDVRVLCGVNLAMLLGYVSWRESLELPDLVRRLINTGRDAIVEAVIDR
jgi:mannose/fructose-specific phosphotransferase system component IIA